MTERQKESQQQRQTFSHNSHLFNTDIASEYGVHQAIIIQHFIHWISLNRASKRNFIEGRTWSYQTIDEICNHFPYFTKEEVREAIEKLCKGKHRRKKNGEKDFEPVLMKGNFNKSKFDKTAWYAFIDEERFLGTRNSKNVYERAYAQIGQGGCPNGEGLMPTPIPDNKTDISKKEKIYKKESPPPDPKRRFLEFVELTASELEKLQQRLGKDATEHWIEKLNAYIGSTGSKYKSHYHTIINWTLKEKEEAKPVEKERPKKEMVHDEVKRLVTEKFKDGEKPIRVGIGEKYVEIHKLHRNKSTQFTETIHYDDKQFHEKLDGTLEKIKKLCKAEGLC